ncbi:hypothetical protein J2810_002776 [Chryseobacterium rhizosphaerae]|uniref:hypothetical protein n=1 Tax=Chryseobacterium rhizosphaerae TaxID=395937 RepID=UPI00285F4208|nr:hypothetical protein [Chryseobacterium rhizosphaerae]MDR6546670.1 hypothetical protein [Chryseobacterium rhizosphaerae]MDR6546716.1 hypothetical protein [Chryseobacterium rhizosphaerae]
MKRIILITILFILVGCSQKNNEIISFYITFGNALHGGITLDFDNSNKLLILKRIGSKKISIPPPPPPSELGYSKEQRDSIGKAEQQYYLDYAQPKTTAYKLTKEEANTLNTLINSIPKEDRKDFFPKYPMVDGFTYNFQIIYSDGKVEDAEIQHINIPSHEKIIYQMLIYAKKYEKDKNNIQVLKNFEDWNHPKY